MITPTTLLKVTAETRDRVNALKTKDMFSYNKVIMMLLDEHEKKRGMTTPKEKTA